MQQKGNKMARDWVGNKNSIYTTLGASNHTDKEREENDYYATEPRAIDLLLEKEKFSHHVWECACGQGHLSNRLEEFGYKVFNSDLILRGGCNDAHQIDFLAYKPENGRNDMDIITNPPYKYAKEFVEHALEISMESVKVAMFLKLTFLESTGRRKMFEKYPPKKVYVASGRLKCAKNGNFDSIGGSAAAYAWFVWEKGFKGKPTIEWIN